MRGWLVMLAACTGPSPTTSLPVQPTDPPTTLGEDPRVEGITAAHNTIRSALGLPDLVWDQALADASASWSVELDARGCILEHNLSAPYGENLYWSSVPTDAVTVVTGWASEVEDYDYAANTCDAGKMCGHYTQVVWENTARIGCARHECSGGAGQLWMCSYDPPGNFVGERPY